MTEKKHKKKKILIIKMLTVTLIFINWLLYRFIVIQDSLPWDSAFPIKDYFQLYVLYPFTYFLSQHLFLRDALTIIASSLLDICIVTYLIVSIKKGTSWKPYITIGLFYFVRGTLIQTIFLFPIPDNYLMADPSFPSLSVSTERAADFFFSGHTGISFMFFLHYRDYGYKALKYFCLGLSMYEALYLVITRNHYSIDVIFGVICSYYCFTMGCKLAVLLDRYVPIFGRFDSVNKDSLRATPMNPTHDGNTYGVVTNGSSDVENI